MRKKFNIDKLVFGLLIVIVIGVFLVPIFGEQFKEFEKKKAKSSREYKYSVVEKDGWYSSDHCRFSVEEWDDLYLKYSGYTEVSEFLHYIDNHVDAISELLGMSKLGNQIITFTLDREGYGIVDRENNIVKYSNYYFLNDLSKAPVAREVSELIAGSSSSDGLTEGLYFYIEQYIDKNLLGNSVQQDIICRAKVDMNERNNVMIKYVGQDGGYTYADEDGKAYIKTQTYALHIFNRSFARYLIDEYGLDKYLELYFSEDINSQYQKIYDKSSDKLKDDWIECVNKRYKEVYGE